MPASKFYPIGSVEGDDPFLYVGWANPGNSLTGVTVNAVELDRSGLNRLIRDLRRARDATYGKDE